MEKKIRLLTYSPRWVRQTKVLKPSELPSPVRAPPSTLTSTDRPKSRLYRSIFPVHFTTVPANKTNKFEYATIRYPAQLMLCAQIVEIRTRLTPEELFGSLSVIIAHKHERNDKRSTGFSFLHVNWLTRSRQTVRFSCARERLDIRERNQVMNLWENKASTT